MSDVEALLDNLGVARLAVTGTSGGGPHALAVAAKLPDRILRRSASSVWAVQGEAVLHRELTQVAAEDLARMAADPAKVFSDDWQLPASDREVLSRSDMQQRFAETMREVYRTGVWGWVDDDLAFVAPWGFDPG